MEIAKSNIVRSNAGRDQGKLFCVMNVEGEYLLLADGKSRKVELPKRKKRRHDDSMGLPDHGIRKCNA